MSLQVLKSPEYTTNVPSTKQTIKFRPFLVQEENLLFMALQGGDQKEMTNAVSNIIKACVLTEDFNVDKLAMFDVEYLFLQLRGKSVGENVDLRLKHPKGSECKNIVDVSVNLDQINVTFPEEYSDKIQLTDEVGIKLQFPGVKHIMEMGDIDVNNQNFDQLLDFVCSCVLCIYDNDNVYDTFTRDEIKSFLESLSQKQFEKVQQFFSNAPKLQHKIEWTCNKCGEKETIHMEGLASFFT